ncbi:MAG: glucose-6-phosphate isomerase [Pseudomonadota bacterium]
MTSQPALSARYPLDLPAWSQLTSEAKKMRQLDIASLVKSDRQRYERCTARAADIVLDFSRQRLRAGTLRSLVSLAKQAKVEPIRDAMFAGQTINNTEDRAVLHTLLRAGRVGRDHPLADQARGVQSVLRGMLKFVDSVIAGEHTGVSGRAFTDVINIGIGGSDLGIDMAGTALAHVGSGLNLHCVSNVDGTQLADLTKTLDPSRTLIVVCSKTFTTLETMTNAQAARDWVSQSLGECAVADHFAAASTNHAAMDAFGIKSDRRFGFWDWVGGRYSLWSAVGLSIALAVGSATFRELLKGARVMDRHFQSAPLAENVPVLMALVAVWNSHFLGAETHAILPYDHRLARFPAYLQQLQMESNGKSVRRDGRPVRTGTGAVIWGEPGSNAQHSFYQLLHQGTRICPADFILPARSSGASQVQQDLAIANCVAQADALAFGYSEAQAYAELIARGMSRQEASELSRHKVHGGNRPSSLLLFKQLNAHTLGQLIALYEHKVFVEGVIFGINSFDQWGVELGKKMASSLAPGVADASAAGDASVVARGALATLRKWRA